MNEEKIETDFATANIEQLLQRASDHDEPTPEFRERVRQSLLAESSKPRTANSVAPRRWSSLGFTIPIAIAAAFVGGLLVGHYRSDPANSVQHVTLPQPESSIAPEADGKRQPTPIPVTRVMHSVGADGATCISYVDLDLAKKLNVDRVKATVAERLPEDLKQLSGKRVRIRGFMVPSFLESGLRGFRLARDNNACCFGPNPKVTHVIPVKLRDGVTTDYIHGRPFDVEGTFFIEPAPTPDGELDNLYCISDAVVVPR